jgi:hypothetical protein
MFVMFDAGYLPVEECDDPSFRPTKEKNDKKLKKKYSTTPSVIPVMVNSEVVQPGQVALTTLGVRWIDISVTPDLHDHSITIYNIYEFETFEINTLYKNRDDLSRQFTQLRQRVEWECPVGRYFGVKSSESFERYLERTSKNQQVPKGVQCSTGEGIVWRMQVKTPSGVDKVFRIKIRGDEHRTSHVAPEEAIDVERLNSIDEFVAKALSGYRLRQGIKAIFGDEDMSMKWFDRIGKFKQWVVHDVKKEDMAAFPEQYIDDYSGKNGAEKKASIEKELNRRISEKTHDWFRNLVEMGVE